LGSLGLTAAGWFRFIGCFRSIGCSQL